MNDIAEKITTAIDGKTGRANAPINANDDFQAGFTRGKLAVKRDESGLDVITVEWLWRGSPETISPSFKEWKRGMWAAIMQGAIAKAAVETNGS